jgi:predicted nucleic acid-binding protein
MLLVDTNVLLDVVQDDPDWAPWSAAQLRAQSRVHGLAVNPIVYAELAIHYDTLRGVEDVVLRMGLKLHELPRDALFLAGKAFLRYRRQGGTRTSVLPDFFIGAHAAVNRWPLLTRDAARYRTYFPTLQVIAP